MTSPRFATERDTHPRTTLHDRCRASAFGTIMASFSLGILIGPVIGAFLNPLVAASVAAATGGFCMLFIAFLLPESLSQEDSEAVRMLTHHAEMPTVYDRSHRYHGSTINTPTCRLFVEPECGLLLRSAVLGKRRRPRAYPTGWACGSSCAAACSKGSRCGEFWIGTP